VLTGDALRPAEAFALPTQGRRLQFSRLHIRTWPWGISRVAWFALPASLRWAGPGRAGDGAGGGRARGGRGGQSPAKAHASTSSVGS